MLVDNGERHNLCHPRHTICLQLNPLAYVHPDIKSYPSVKCLLLLPLLLPLPFAPSCLPFPISPFKLPPPSLLPLSQSCLPLPTPLLLVHPPASPIPPHSWPLPALLHLPLPSPLPPPRLPAPLLPVHPPLGHYLHLNKDMLQLLLSFCSFAHLR